MIYSGRLDIAPLWGYVGVVLGYIGMMEIETEATMWDLGFRVEGSACRL